MRRGNSARFREWATDFGFFIVGGVLYGLSVNLFTAPNQIAPGGLTGLSTVFNFLWGTPIGGVIFLLNIPLFLWAILSVGYKLVIKTIVATAVSSAAIDILSLVVPPYQNNLMLAAVFGGVVEGFALALIFMRGGTTGGTDMVARLLGRYFPHISMARLMMCLDALVVTFAAFVYRSLESAMYALIVIFVATRLIDAVLYGTDAGTGKLLYIISEKNEQIAAQILTDLDRGVTYLKSRGAYSGRESELLLCAVRRYEVCKANAIVRELDPNAFVIVGDAGEISGEGFRQVKSGDKTLRELLRRKNRHKKKDGGCTGGERCRK